MEGLILLATILTSLGLGYSSGINTKKKRILNENKVLKKQVTQLKKEIDRLRTIRHDYDVKHGIYKKKSKKEFKGDLQILLQLDKENRIYVISLITLLLNSNINLQEKFKIDTCDKYLKLLEESEKDFLELKIHNQNISVDLYDIRYHLQILFNDLIDINDYEITYEEIIAAIKNELENIKDFKKFRRAFARDFKKN